MPPQTRRIYQHPSLTNPSAQLQGAFMEWEVPLPGPVQAYKNYRGTPEQLAAYLRDQGLLGGGLRDYLYLSLQPTGNPAVLPIEENLPLAYLGKYLRFDSYADTVVYLPALTAADLPASVIISHTSVSGTNTVTVKGSNPFGGLETFAVLSSGEAVALAGANLNGTVGWVKTGAVGGPAYTDAQARAAQLGRTAPAGTTTVMLTAEAPADYGTAASGTFTVDATSCVVGKVACFAVGAGASAPAFTNAPAGQPYKFLPANIYASGYGFSYSLLVRVDRIEVVILPD